MPDGNFFFQISKIKKLKKKILLLWIPVSVLQLKNCGCQVLQKLNNLNFSKKRSLCRHFLNIDGFQCRPTSHEPPLHTSHSCKTPQQHPLHVDTSLGAKKNFFSTLAIFCQYGPLKCSRVKPNLIAVIISFFCVNV